MFTKLKTLLGCAQPSARSVRKEKRRRKMLAVERLEERALLAPVTFTLTRIEELVNPDDSIFDSTPGDYFAKVSIAGQPSVTTPRLSVDPGFGGALLGFSRVVFEPYWRFTRDVDPAAGPVQIQVELFDHDFSPDDRVDISPVVGAKTLNLTVDPLTGNWSGDVPMNQGFARGNGDDDSEGRALISFDISVLSTDGDLDGDGLLDGWEQFGLDYNGDGVKLDLPGFGANPRHKDLFLEIDAMPGQAPSREEILAMKAAFAVAPATAGTNASALGRGVDAKVNPDGLPGISLWVDSVNGDALGGGNLVPTEDISGLNSEFFDVKRLNFDSADRRPVFRYALSAVTPTNLTGTSSAGNARNTLNDASQTWLRNEWAGRDLTVTITGGAGAGQTRRIVSNTSTRLVVDRNWDRGATPNATSTYSIDFPIGGIGELGGNDFIDYNHDGGSLMHELGHNLGLHHGGEDAVNFKPNYVSVMNYSQQARIDQGSGGASILDYSGSRQTITGIPAILNTATTLADPAATWLTDQWAGGFVEVVGVNRQVRRIISNTATELQLAEAWTTIPTNTDRYALYTANPTRARAPLPDLNEASLLESLVLDPSDPTTMFVFTDSIGSTFRSPLAGVDFDGIGGRDGQDYSANGTIDVGVVAVDINGDSVTGTSSGRNGARTLIDTSAAWTRNQFAGLNVTITAGRGAGQTRAIASNNANTLTLSRAWDSGNVPDTTSRYKITVLSVLRGHDDWSRISLPFRQFGDSANSAIRASVEHPHELHEMEERNEEMRRRLTVTNTADGGIGSLRQAILDANAMSGPNTITFAIPPSDTGFRDLDAHLTGGDSGKDVFVIRPLTPLPALNDFSGGTIVDGHSQARYGGDTNQFGPEIVLDGSRITVAVSAAADGLRLASNNNEITGLNIARFSGDGIQIEGSNNTLAGNFIGTDATGRRAAANAGHGVLIQGTSQQVQARGNHVGLPSRNLPFVPAATTTSPTAPVPPTSPGWPNPGSGTVNGGSDGIILPPGGTTPPPIPPAPPAPALVGAWTGNVISGNGRDGIAIIGSNARGNFVQANLIGVDPSGKFAIGNRNGVAIDHSTANTVGGADKLAANVIANSGAAGVSVTGKGEGNVIRLNSIHHNKGLGIDLGPAGPTSNDIGDADVGPNALQNRPEITATRPSGSRTRVSGVLRSLPNTVFMLDFYATPGVDAASQSEGQRFLTSVRVRTNRLGEARFNVVVNAAATETVTTTATDVARGNTSEFSHSPFALAADMVFATEDLSTLLPLVNSFDFLTVDLLAPRTPG